MAFQELSKEQAKEEIKGLIDKYDKVVKAGKFKSYNEEMQDGDVGSNATGV